MTQTKAMAIIDPRDVPLAVQLVGEERLQLLAEQIGRGWKAPPTPAEIEICALICQENRFNIFAKPPQVHFIKRWDSKLGREVITPGTSIDGMRLAASRSRNYVGPAGYQWCGNDGNWRDVWFDDTPPRAARAGIYVRGSREPLYAVALWDEWAQWQDEYVNGNKTGNKVLAPFWRDKPAHMLAKTAEMMIIKQACPAETDKLELAHLEELDRLEAPSNARRYDEIFTPGGVDYQEFTPTRERLVEDRPRAALTGPTVTTTVAPQGVVVHPDPAEAKRRRDRGNLLEEYGGLLSQAVQAGAVKDATEWVLRADLPDVGIISRGRELRAALNKYNMERATAQRQATDEVTEENIDPGDLGEGGWAEASAGDVNSGPGSQQQPPVAPPKTEMVKVRTMLADKLAGLIEDASRLEVDFDDCRASLPAPKEEVLRKIERLEERLEAKKARLAGTLPAAAPAAPEQQPLEDIPF